MIELKGINKSFKVAKRDAGFFNAAKAIFHKEFTTIDALVDISFKVQKGEIVGYIGPNGAGKSSTIKIMSGILHPDNGQCTINGLTPWKDRKEHVRNIGVVFGQRSQLWWEVPVIDTFELLKDIYDLDKRKYQLTLTKLIELLHIGDLLHTPVRQLSLGQRMRCEIAASLIHQPSILFLDEPTIGLDAVSKLAVRSFFKTLNQEEKTTIILTTHDMQDISALTKRIILIGKGKILLDGSLHELTQYYTHQQTIIAEYMNGEWTDTQNIQLVRHNNQEWEFEFDAEQLTVAKAINMITQQIDVQSISLSRPSTEEVVLNLYEDYQI